MGTGRGWAGLAAIGLAAALAAPVVAPDALGAETVGAGPPPSGPGVAVPVERVEVVVLVTYVRDGRGQVRIALWDRADGFPEEERAVAGTAKPATVGEVRFVFPGLAPGRYAAIVYHDEDDNGELDRNWFGWPREGLGFSNGAWIRFGAPAFDEAAVTIDAQSRAIRVTLRY